jgi:hypothetical protein
MRSNSHGNGSKTLARLALGLALVLIAAASAQAQEEDYRKPRGAVFSIGYGQLSVDAIEVAGGPQGAEAFERDDWHTVVLTGGWYFNRGRTQLLGDLMFSEQKDLDDHIRNAPLVGGGTTKVSSDVLHLGAFVGVRQSVWRLYGDLGYGIITQEKDIDYEPAVSNPGVGDSVSVQALYWGLGARVTRNVMVGFRRYESRGVIFKDDHDPVPDDPGIEATTFHVTMMF